MKHSLDLMRAIGAEWLRYSTPICPLITWERTPVLSPYAQYSPDLLGVDKKRRVIEIEVKRTLADFKADADKPIWKARKGGYAPIPYQFYYFVPPALVDKVRPLLDPCIGLLSFNEKILSKWSKLPAMKVIVSAKTNPKSIPLTLKEMVTMVKHQSSAATRALAAVALVCPVEEIPPLPEASAGPIISDHVE